MRNSLNSSRRLFTLVLAAVALSFGTLAASADPPAAPAAPVVATPQNSTPAPQNPTPSEPPATAPAARREETETQVPPATAPVATGPSGAKPNLFQKAVVFLQSREGIAADLAQRDRTIVDLRAQVADRDQTIANQNAELAELRAGRDQLQAAVSRLESQRSTVTDTVAALGFPASQLPATGNGQHATGSADALREELKATSDPKQRFRLSNQIREIENPKQEGSHSRN